MFYDSKLMNGSVLKNAWRAGNKQELCPEDVPLLKVCRVLDSWIASDYQDPCRRLALRASSVLVEGAARLYQEGLNQLLEDVYEMEYQMITRNSRRSKRALLNEEFSQSDDNDSSPGRSASTVKSNDRKSKRNDTSNSQLNRSQKDETYIVTRGSRRCGSSRRSRKLSNEELSFGQIFIYDHPTSKVPSKIIVGKINPDVKKNM